jgi:Uma2 family endonuclease
MILWIKKIFIINYTIIIQISGDDTMTTIVKENRKKYTYTDYEKLPEGAPYQLIGGNLVMTPSPVPSHQIVSRNIEFELLTFVRQRKLGEVLDAPIDVYFSDTETYQPDIIFIAQERLFIIGEKKIEGSPDLVIEILSSSTAKYDRKHKKDVYEQSGVKEYWIVNPFNRSIEVFENTAKGFLLYEKVTSEGMVTSRLLEGFRISLKDIFSD